MGKRFDGCYNVFAWINNGFWGTLFIVFGIYSIFWQQNFWMGVLGVGVGIYFFWTKSWTRKTIEIIAGEDQEQPTGLPGSAEAGQPEARAATEPVGPFGRTTPSGSVSQRKTFIKNAFIAAALLFMVLGARALSMGGESMGTYMVIYGGLTLACFFVYARITIHRATEDVLPALPWGEMIVAVLTHAFSPNSRHVSYTTPEGAAAAVDKAAHPVAAAAQLAEQPATNAVVPPGSVTKRKLIIRNMILFASLVIMIFGFQAIKDDVENFFPLVLGYGIPTVALALLASRVRFDRVTEDEQQAAPWGESIAATLKGAIAPRAQAGVQPDASAQTPETAGAGVVLASTDSPAADAAASTPGVEHALAAADGAVKAATSRGKTAIGWFSSLSGNAKAGVVAGAIVLVFVAGFMVSNATSNASSDGSDGRASVNIDNLGGTGGDYTPTDTSSSSDSAAGQDGASAADSSGQSAVTPADQPEVLPLSQRQDLQGLIGDADADGAQADFYVWWDNGISASSGQLCFTGDGGDFVHAFAIGRTDPAKFYVDDVQKSADEFFTTITGSERMYGSVAYTKDGVVSVHVQTVYTGGDT